MSTSTERKINSELIGGVHPANVIFEYFSVSVSGLLNLPLTEDQRKTGAYRVNAALKEANCGIKAGADSHRPGNSAWQCNGDLKQLAAQMNEDANERIQLARVEELQDNADRRRRRRMPKRTGKGRQGICFGVHCMDRAPFEMKDSRYEKLNIEDTLGYQPLPSSSNTVVTFPFANGNGRSRGHQQS